MTERDELLALFERVAPLQYATGIAFTFREFQMVLNALRSASRTGPDEADNGIINAAKFVASQDREMLAQMLFALHERHDSPSPVRFNCGWKQLKSFNRASFYRCSDAIRAIAALPAPGGITPVPQLEPWRDELSEIIGHLGAAIVQSTASDDQIIMDHVKAAHGIAKIVRRKA